MDDLITRYGASQTKACALLRISRSLYNYRSRARDARPLVQRIKEISGHDLADPEVHFNLELATRAWHTLLALRGESIEEARAPQYLETATGRVALVSVASADPSGAR